MSSTEKNNDALRLAALLQCGADDPMWDQHCEMRKDTVANAAAELRRLHARVWWLERADKEWSEKTDWVQETAKTNELGMHRADVLRARIEALHAENEELRADADRYRWLKTPRLNVGHGSIFLKIDDRSRGEWPPARDLLGEEMDCAIDAAREIQKGGAA